MKIELRICASAFVLGAAMANTAMAGEEKYPAASFQPSVIYSNAELIAKSGSASSSAQAAAPVAADPKYPAAYFAPSVIYPSK